MLAVGITLFSYQALVAGLNKAGSSAHLMAEVSTYAKTNNITHRLNFYCIKLRRGVE